MTQPTRLLVPGTRPSWQTSPPTRWPGFHSGSKGHMVDVKESVRSETNILGHQTGSKAAVPAARKAAPCWTCGGAGTASSPGDRDRRTRQRGREDQLRTSAGRRVPAGPQAGCLQRHLLPPPLTAWRSQSCLHTFVLSSSCPLRSRCCSSPRRDTENSSFELSGTCGEFTVSPLRVHSGSFIQLA